MSISIGPVPPVVVNVTSAPEITKLAFTVGAITGGWAG
jgi:hypothetical protein